MRIYKRLIKRIIIYGKSEERKKALDHCYLNNFNIIMTGPKRRPGHLFDLFKIVAEKEIHALYKKEIRPEGPGRF